jgi:hypothetical protein
MIAYGLVHTVNVELHQGRLIFDKATTYPSVLFVGRTGHSDPTILIAIMPSKGSLKDNNNPRLVSAPSLLLLLPPPSPGVGLN